MSERLKLTRGLADISPIFEKEKFFSPAGPRIVEPQTLVMGRKAAAAPEIYFIWSEDDEGDAHFLNNFFASKMVEPDAEALLMSFEDKTNHISKEVKAEPWNRSLRRISLPEKRIQEAFNGSNPKPSPTANKIGTQIFLEMNINSLSAHPALVRSLDHVVFFLKPQVESVTETYRKLKYLAALGMKAEVTVLFDADDAAGLPSRLYELFSDFVSRRLSLSMNYLGTLHLSRGADGLRQDICWESWNSMRSSLTESIEKMHFLTWVEKLNQEEALR